jgi:hypothetical protein
VKGFYGIFKVKTGDFLRHVSCSDILFHLATCISQVLTSLIKYNLDNLSMAIICCKICGEYRYLTPHAFWNMTDVGIMCKKCDTTNTITLEDGELRKQS